MFGCLPELNCPECQTVTAISQYCFPCKKSLCEDCVDKHLGIRSNRFHETLSLGGEESESRDIVQCNDHQGFAYLVHCCQCDTPCCGHCLTENHQGHECVHIQDKVEEKSEKLLAYVTELGVVSQELAKERSEIEDHENKYAIDINMIHETIATQREKLKREIDQICDALMSDVNVVQEHDVESFRGAKDDIQTIEANLVDVLESCNGVLQTGGTQIVIKSKTCSDTQAFAHHKTSFPVPLLFENVTETSAALKKLCGKLVRQKGTSTRPTCIPTVDMTIQKSFTTTSHKYPVVAISANEAWFADDNSLVSRDDSGQETSRIALDFTPHDFVLTAAASFQFVATDFENKCIKSVDKAGQIGILVDVQPLSPAGIHQNSKGDLIVCLFGDNCTGKIVKHDCKTYAAILDISTDSSGQPFLNKPHRVFENWNGDICVTDDSKVVALDSSGTLKWTYDGSQNQTKSNSFRPRGICCDRFEAIIVCDENNHTVDILDKNGQFLATFQIGQQGVSGPQDLSITEEKFIWLSDASKIYKFNYLK